MQYTRQHLTNLKFKMTLNIVSNTFSSPCWKVSDVCYIYRKNWHQHTASFRTWITSVIAPCVPHKDIPVSGPRSKDMTITGTETHRLQAAAVPHEDTQGLSLPQRPTVLPSDRPMRSPGDSCHRPMLGQTPHFCVREILPNKLRYKFIG